MEHQLLLCRCKKRCEETESTNTVSTKEWKRWCRLCAKYDGDQLNIFADSQKADIQAFSIIMELFHFEIKPNDELPHLLCPECWSLINYLEKYAKHVRKVQVMYHDLINVSNLTPTNPAELFIKYNISKLESYMHETFSENDITNTSAIEQVYVADLSIDVVKSEAVEEMNTDFDAEIKLEPPDPFATDKPNKDEEHDHMSDDEANSVRGSRNLSTDSKDSLYTNEIKDLKKDAVDDKKEGSYACNICECKFSQRRNYVWHMKSKHNTETPHKCTACQSVFKYKKELERHMKKMHAPTVYDCSYCDKKFQGSKTLENHIKSQHEREGWCICEECGESVRSQEKLLEHMALHTGHGAFGCKECGKHFARKSYLKIHSQIHGEKHVCGECGLELTTSKSLNVHMKVHSDEMPHACNYCGRKFRRTKDLKKHLITHTGLKPFSCDFCDKTFSSGTSCRYHKKHLHPKELAEQEAAGVKAYTKNIPKIDVLKAILQGTDAVKEMVDGASDKRIRLPKLDAELPNT
ncbi:zinc finger protein 124 isoform X2 [Ceratitis capitata]|uniref:zinc finger protein 124 isoform X2 n=1 Tax=Ceratitis capitata TaxID=7213 RepID=UPI000329FA9C|nr:zinc finger protein 124 isoform X2 [Ceratitis capitata]